MMSAKTTTNPSLSTLLAVAILNDRRKDHTMKQSAICNFTVNNPRVVDLVNNLEGKTVMVDGMAFEISKSKALAGLFTQLVIAELDRKNPTNPAK